MKTTSAHWLIAAAFVLGGAGAAADPIPGGKAVYRWTDAQGHVHYGDRMPPEAAAGGHEQIDASGKVRQTVEHEKSPEQLAAESKARREAEAQATHDRSLLQTYPSLEDLQSARRDKLHALDDRAAALEKSIEKNDVVLRDLRARAGQPEDEPGAAQRVQNQIKTFEAVGREDREALAKVQIDRSETDTRFAADAERYAALKGGASSVR